MFEAFASLGVVSILMGVMWLELAGFRMGFGVLARRIEGYSVTEHSVVKDNPAVLVRVTAAAVAFVYVLSEVLHPSGIGWIEDLNLIAKHSLVVFAALYASRWINDFLILSDFPNNREVLEERNVAVAAIEASTFLATATIMAGALRGWDGGILASLGWFAGGQLLLVILAAVYRRMMGAVNTALDNHNLACGYALGGFLLSGGVALGYAIADKSPVHGATFMAAWVAVMVVTYLVMHAVMIHGSSLKKEIMEEKNWGVGLMQGALFVLFTYLLTKVW